MAERNPAEDFANAVAAALAEYEPEDDLDFTGRVVAVLCDDEEDADEAMSAMEGAGLTSETVEHDGKWYAWVTDLHGSDPNDVVFELSEYNYTAGSIPDPRGVLS